MRQSDPSIISQLKGEWQLHQRKAERAYHRLREDTALAQSNPKIDMITFDLQQSLPTPTLTVNVVFYKRQLWVYNLGIHCCATGVGFMHMWDESIASRGSQDIGSCVLAYLKEHRTSAEHLIAYSDSCGGQNRNINIVCLWLHIVSSPDFTYTLIDHKFMLSSHSYLLNDRDFGGIETARRRAVSLFVPDNWYSLVENARRTNPFQVRRMLRNDFLSTTQLSSMIVNRKTTVTGDKVEWLKMQWIRVEKASPFILKYRHTHNDLEEWKVVDLRPRRSGRPSDMGPVVLNELYSGPRAIGALKLKDLLALLCYVPPIHHDFYRGLTSSSEEVD